MNVFGNKIKRLREGKNMSIRMLAQEIGISSGQISKYENGIHEPTLSVLNKYCKIISHLLQYFFINTF